MRPEAVLRFFRKEVDGPVTGETFSFLQKVILFTAIKGVRTESRTVIGVSHVYIGVHEQLKGRVDLKVEDFSRDFRDLEQRGFLEHVDEAELAGYLPKCTHWVSVTEKGKSASRKLSRQNPEVEGVVTVRFPISEFITVS